MNHEGWTRRTQPQSFGSWRPPHWAASSLGFGPGAMGHQGTAPAPSKLEGHQRGHQGEEELGVDQGAVAAQQRQGGQGAGFKGPGERFAVCTELCMAHSTAQHSIAPTSAAGARPTAPLTRRSRRQTGGAG